MVQEPPLGPCKRICGAIGVALLCAGTWAPCAHCGTQPSGTPRTEFFVAAGTTIGYPAVVGELPAWVTLQAGGAYCVTRSVAVGVATGWNFIGTHGILYFPPGGDFTEAKETIAMVPAIGYVKLRLPIRSGGVVPYITAGAGSYTLRSTRKPADAGSYRDSKFGFNTAFGLAGNPGHFSRQVELRYDAVPMERDKLGLIRPHSWLNMFTVSLGLQLP